MQALARISTLLFLAAGAALAATPDANPATTATVSTPATASDLTGLWVLDRGSKLGTIPGGVTLSLRQETALKPQTLHVSGYTGLNYYASSAIVEPGEQRFALSTRLSTTGKWGTAGDMRFDHAFLDALDDVVRFQLDTRNAMTLTTLGGDTLHFRRISN